MKLRIHIFRPKGFALVVTLSLMVLLTIVAVGLLGLASVSLRSTSQGEALSVARANARLALMLAIGELQSHAGPDTRITATGSILENATSAKSPVTGVWESSWFDPLSPPTADDYEKTGGKDRKFRKWLISSSDFEATGQMNFAAAADFPESRRVTLVRPTRAKGSAVYGGLVAVAPKSSGGRGGSYAYAVLDEGVKARIDTGYQPITRSKTGDLADSMGSGARADASRIPGLEKLDWELADLSKPENPLAKIVSFKSTVHLLDEPVGTDGPEYEDLVHDVTTASLGVLSDVANGGLKQDLNSILNADKLPADFSGASNSKVYSTHLGFPANSNAVTGRVEPSWDQLHHFANLYKNTLQNKSGPLLAMQTPVGWVVPTQPPPANSRTTPLMPALLKMQMFYSLIAVPMWKSGNHVGDPNSMPPENNWTEPEGGHVRWQRTAWGMGARYFMVLCMMPCVTLHNPYNTTLEVRDLAVELSNVPISIQLNRRKGGSESGWLPRDGQAVDMVDSVVRATTGRKFLFDLTGDGGNKLFNMAPGEVRVFTATAPANANYLDNPYRSWNGFTDPMNAKPMTLTKGFRGVTIGYYAPRITTNELQGYESYPGGPTARGSLEYLAPGDKVRVRIRPCLDKRITTTPAEKGKCKVALIKSGTSGTNPMVYSALTLNVGTERESGNLLTGLEEALEAPSGGVELDWVSTPNMAGTSGDQKLNEMKAYTFAIMTISAKTTHGDYEDKDYEGILPAKPMSFHSPVGSFVSADVAKYGLEPYPIEASSIALDSSNGTGYENHLEVDAEGRSFAVSGLTSLKGQQFATFYEIPMGPLRNFMQLNSANPASTHSLARFTYPIGNSWAHPMIPPTGIATQTMAGTYDHSFLLNSLLFDRFYFSGIAPHAGGFMTPAGSDTVARSFVKDGNDSLIPDKRLTLHLPDGITSESAVDTLSTASDSDPETPQARYQAAAHQLMKGAFNVNSTSKLAWKAMLASLHAPDARMFLIGEGSKTASITGLEPVATGEARFSRFLVPNNNAPESAADRQQVFQGPRDISAPELDALAEAIVREVRGRGPFLSMAEFVNRQLGTSAKAQKGALQAAIDATGINGSGPDSVLADSGYELAAKPGKYLNPAAMEGRSDQGAPGFLSQADLLSVLGNAATVRSDTFTIRAYGDARDASGNVISQVWCEAVVQRTPEYVSPEDQAHIPVKELVSAENQRFGRRFTVLSFRWLAPGETGPEA